MSNLSIKLLKWAQQAGGAGWNKHVSPWLRRKANKRMRNYFKNSIKLDLLK